MSEKNFAYFDQAKPRILGHRGASGLAPENTLPSFELAAAVTDYIETDMWLTIDDVPVFLHDQNLLRTCGADVDIGEVTFEELKQFDAGFTFKAPNQTHSFRDQGILVPSVEEIFKTFPNKKFNIEIKDAKPHAIQKLLEVAASANALDRILIAAEDDTIMKNVRAALHPTIPTSACFGEVFAFLQGMLAGKLASYSCKANAFQIPDKYETHDLGDAKIIQALHAMGIEAHYWTINDPKRMQELIANGADGIVTDFPGLARDSLLSI